jgi:pimeloyl-ACP methyl ester carboxylesterase
VTTTLDHGINPAPLHHRQTPRETDIMTSQTHSVGAEPGHDAASTPAAPSSTTTDTDGEPRGHIGRIMVGSLATGLLTGLLLVAAPFIPAQENTVTGALLCGFAAGWAMLAVLSVRYTAQPQRWAAVPAAVMGLGGILLIGFGPQVRDALNWIWPPALFVTVVWVVVRARRQLPSRIRHWLLYPVLAVLALASVGGGYETAWEMVDATAFPMPGQLIDVGGHRLHLNCTGSGSPTVVLEPGAGAMSSSLGLITPEVARTTRVCVYDRAGRGWSEPADTPQDGAQIAADLHTLLHNAHIPGPYVLAGHSFGGLYVLTFAARYPDEVAGMVLVDSTAPASAPATVPPSAMSGDQTRDDLVDRVCALASIPARLGLARVYGQLSPDDLPPRSNAEALAGSVTAPNIRSTINEYVQGSASVRQAAALLDFADKPLVVLTAGTGNDASWAATQNRLAALSSNSVHRVVADATHQSLVADRGHAAVTAQAIAQVVSSVRSAGPSTR